jgi:hypothetical protein
VKQGVNIADGILPEQDVWFPSSIELTFCTDWSHCPGPNLVVVQVMCLSACRVSFTARSVYLLSPSVSLWLVVYKWLLYCKLHAILTRLSELEGVRGTYINWWVRCKDWKVWTMEIHEDKQTDITCRTGSAQAGVH